MLDFWNYFQKNILEGNPPWNNFIKVGGIAQGTQLTGRPPIAGGWTRSAAHRSGKMDKALVLAPIFIHFHWDSLHIRRGSGPRLICMWVASTSLPGGHHALLQSCCGLAALDADAGRGLSEKCWTTPKSIGVSWYIYIYHDVSWFSPC